MKYFLPPVLVFFALSAFSQTNVSGTLVSNTEWTLSGSPYNLVATLGVVSGATLTIQAGVVVNGNFDLVVKGAIRVNGLQANPVSFNDTRVIFKSTNLILSSINHTQFNNAGIQLADEAEHAQDITKNSNELVVSNSIFINSAYAKTKGYETTAWLRLEDCSFTNAIIFGFYPRSEIIDLVRATVESSNIESDSYNRGIHVNNSTVNNSTFKIGCCGANISVSDSEISNSTFANGGGSPVNGPLDFRRVKFANTSLNLPNARVSIEQCSFSASSLATSFIVTIGNGSIKKSTFQGTSVINGLKITGYSGYDLNGSVLVENVGFETLNEGIEISNFGSIQIDQSNFIDINSYNLVNTSNKNVDARNNYWGTADELVIQNRILDLYDNINYGEVNYSDYVVLPFIIDPLPVPMEVFKGIHQNGTLLHWSKPSDPRVIGYKIYRKSGNEYSQLADAGDVDTFVVTEGITSEFVVTAYNGLADGLDDQVEGNESAYSLIGIPFISITNANSISICEDKEFDIMFALNYPFENSSNLKLEASILEDFANPIQVGSFGAAPGYVWALPDTITAIRTIYYRLISDQFEIKSEAKSIKIKPNPDVDFSFQPQTETPGSYLVSITGIIPAMNVIWDTSGATISAEQGSISFVATWTTSGSKNVTLLASLDGCETTITNSQLVVLPIPIVTGLTEAQSLNLHPNPTQSEIRFFHNTETIFDIMDQTGSVILHGKVVTGENIIGLNHFATGMYYLRILSNGERKISKFVKTQ